MKLVSLILLCTCLALEVRSQSGDPIVEIKQGKLRGTTLKSRDGRDYSAFRNVPYATANRFENPRPAQGWGDGVYNATKMGTECAQYMWITHHVSGVEDCLQLNIYTPNVNGNYPVMVYFHGGGFTIGTANYYHGDYFMDEDMVLVIVNYRLGPFGFLSTGDDVISGNFGLKDQQMALHFVSKNIARFGGNPGSVTIFGGSAGAASVNYQMLSPLSKNLFHGAISQSGSALCPWALPKNQKVIVQKYARALDCPLESKKLLKCLQDKSVKELLDAMKPLVEFGYDPFTPFGPTIEPENEGAFLTEDPETLLKTGRFNRVPWMSGVAEHEGILMHSVYILNNTGLAQEMQKNWREIFPITLEYNQVYGNVPQQKQAEATEKIRNFYFGEKIPGTEEARQELTDLFGDRYFNYGIKKSSLLAAKYVPVYSYVFSYYRGDFTINLFFGINQHFGVTHAEELSLLFSQTFDIAPDFKKGSVGEGLSKKLIKLWVSFARDRKPTKLWPMIKSWEPIGEYEITGREPLKYLWINTEMSVKEEHFTDRLKFWDNLLANELRDGASPNKEEL